MNARALVLVLLLAAGAVSAEVPVPALTARVTDLTSTLDEGQRAALEARLDAFEREKGSQIAVLLVPTTEPETIEQYAIRVGDAWKPGRKGIDDGVLLLVAKDDRAVRIDVRYGLEGALPDAIANRITDDVIVPRFRDGDYYGGLSEGVERIIAVIEGEPLPPPRRTLPSDTNLWFMVLAPLAVGGLVRATLNRFSGAAVGGGLAGGLGWWITGTAAAGFGLALFCFLLILGAGQGRGRRGGWSSGGWGGGYSSGGGWGGGGGGWSGGGGLGGGGGATGRW